ncbi:MAG: NAD(P)/FAD-dependent oxidoreductase [Anaerolineae bacterium]
MKALIIGNSAAAVGAIESIRQYDQACEIMVISEEPHMIYSRPMLSHYLAGEIEKPRLAYRDRDFYTRHQVNTVLSDGVAAIDTAAREVRTHAGLTYGYDKLLVATGGVPIAPPVPGFESQGVYTFTRLDDAVAINDCLESTGAKRAVVVGGGMIGIKATDALMKRGLAITLVELAPRILSAALDEAASRLITDLMEASGVDVRAGNSVARILNSEGRVSAVELQDGQTIPCDLLVFGIGVRPNSALAQQAGITVNRGVVVDEYMRTSAPDVYAAGDVAEAYDLVVDMNRTVAIWPNAYRQGAIAGAHMVGVQRPDKGGIAMNTIEICGVPAMSIGNANVAEEGYEIMSELDARRRRYKRLVLKDDRLVGAIFVGNISRAGIYTGIIRHKLDVSSYRKNLMSEHFGLLSVPIEYRKHIVTGSGIEV